MAMLTNQMVHISWRAGFQWPTEKTSRGFVTEAPPEASSGLVQAAAKATKALAGLGDGAFDSVGWSETPKIYDFMLVNGD